MKFSNIAKTILIKISMSDVAYQEINKHLFF